jgi:hypothetical protein
MNTIMLVLAVLCFIVAVYAACRRDAIHMRIKHGDSASKSDHLAAAQLLSHNYSFGSANAVNFSRDFFPWVPDGRTDET